jgi:hypothetical protein
MNIETRVIPIIEVNIRLDENHVINFDLLFDLFVDKYYEYFEDIFVYETLKNLSIADIEIRYSGRSDINYITDTNYKSFLPLFKYLEDKAIIKLFEFNGNLYMYNILDINLLKIEIDNITELVDDTCGNYKVIERDALLNNLIED